MTKYIIHIPATSIEIELQPDVVPTGAAVQAALQIGAVMPGQITVDTTNEVATVGFFDDKGDVATAPDGATAAFASDNEAVATITPDPSNPLSASVTPVAEGTATISVDISGADDPEGNPFTVESVVVTVSPGAAAEAGLTLSV
jgi:hypothetical protein